LKRIFDANLIRPGHYPNHPDLYNLCDEIGMLVFSEIPIWQMRPESLISGDSWDLWIEPQLREMVESFRHHPSAGFWGVANETLGACDYYRRAANYVRGLDPSRPVCAAQEPKADLDAGPIFDMDGRNLHFGWYHCNNVYDGPAIASAVFAATRGRPSLITETGGMASRGSLGGGYSDLARGRETYLDRLLRFNFSFFATVSSPVTGVSVWTWTDFPRDAGTEQHGVLDVYRQPKLVAYSLANLMRGDLRLYSVEKDALVATGGTWRADLRTFNRLRTPRKGLLARWTVLKGQNKVGGGETAFDATAERSQSVTQIEWAAPENAPGGLYAVWIELLDGAKRIHLSGNAFDLYQASCPGVLRIPPAATDGTQPWIDWGGVRLPVYPLVGLLIPVEEGDYRFPAGEGTRNLGVLSGTIQRAVITTLPWPPP